LPEIVASSPGPRAGLCFAGVIDGHKGQRPERASSTGARAICFENSNFEP
jgi:hypothetical protein